MKNTVCGILTVHGNYLLQLRDNKEGIADPGLYGVWGGEVEQTEHVYDALWRELAEETNADVVDDVEHVGVLPVGEPVHTTYHIYHIEIGDFYFEGFMCKEGQRGERFNEAGIMQLAHDGKISKLTRDFLQAYEIRKQAKHRKVILTHGVFDWLHIGHVQHLLEAKAHGDLLVVSLVGDDFVRKGDGRPIFNEAQRCAMLSELKCVDSVFITDAIGPFGHLQLLKPDLYIRGDDCKAQTAPEYELCKTMGIPVAFTSPNPIHTSDILRGLK